jgi:hypothetical protein
MVRRKDIMVNKENLVVLTYIDYHYDLMTIELAIEKFKNHLYFDSETGKWHWVDYGYSNSWIEQEIGGSYTTEYGVVGIFDKTDIKQLKSMLFAQEYNERVNDHSYSDD